MGKFRLQWSKNGLVAAEGSVVVLTVIGTFRILFPFMVGGLLGIRGPWLGITVTVCLVLFIAYAVYASVGRDLITRRQEAAEQS